MIFQVLRLILSHTGSRVLVTAVFVFLLIVSHERNSFTEGFDQFAE